MIRIAIIGGGPGGLMTAYHLEDKCGNLCEITLFEASDRLGGKIVSKKFDKVPVLYEAGLAELYDYSMLGPDPLRQLIESLELKTVPMNGETVVLNDRFLHSRADIKKVCGATTLKAIDDFRQTAMDLMTPEEYYEGMASSDNTHPWAQQTCQDILDRVPDEKARKYLKVAAHSDLATEPYLTNGLYGLKNFLMDMPGYIELYSIEGGIELLPQALAEELEKTKIELNSPVSRVETNSDRTYRLHYQQQDSDGIPQVRSQDFDLVTVALPQNWLGAIEWGNEHLSKAMIEHIAYYSRVGHYLKISILFEKPFWRNQVPGSWFMHEAFGGCCVYDEGARHDPGEYGVLSWLIAGSDAIMMANFDDSTLIEKALSSLPSPLQEGRELFVEGQVHRWLSSVSGLPGGFPVRKTKDCHLPDSKENPGVFLVGDYLFDTTLNGVLDSADVASDLMLTQVMKLKYQQGAGSTNLDMTNGHESQASIPTQPLTTNSEADTELSFGKVNPAYFDNYRGAQSYEQSFDRYFDAKYITDLIKIVWNVSPPYRLLDAGAASGLTLQAFSQLGVNAWGVENNRYIYNQTSEELQDRNLFGNILKLPFPDNYFDFVYETCLCYLPENQIEDAIKELHRVTRRGVIFASITSDLTPKLIEKYNLLQGVKMLSTWWEWSELFFEQGFKLGLTEQKTLAEVWDCTVAAGKGTDNWYADDESLKYCFYTKDIPDQHSPKELQSTESNLLLTR
jgi:monoamine oxidase/SAM-dependent methyltransferase